MNGFKNWLIRISENEYKKAIYFNFDLSCLSWRQLKKTSNDRLPALIEGLVRLSYKFASSLRYLSYPDVSCNVLFIVGSENNKKSIMPVLTGKDHWGVIGYNSALPKKCHIPEFLFYLKSFFRIHRLVLAIFFCKEPYISWAMKKRMDRYLLSFGAVDIWRKIIRKSGCSTLVLSNDHVVWTRSARIAAAELGVKTVFLPHAPTGDSPAPFEFDYGCMDGIEQVRRYQPGKVDNPIMVLTGAVRYENIVRNSVPGGYGLLFCFNTMDSLGFIEQSLQAVRRILPEGNIGVRPHPADSKRFNSIRRICERLHVTFFPPSTSFLSNLEGMHWVFAGVSGVHVDALMARRQPVTISTWYFSDYYGLRSAGLLKVLDSWDSVRNMSMLEEDEFQSKVISLNWNLNDRMLSPSGAVAELIDSVASNGSESKIPVSFETPSFRYNLDPNFNKFPVFQVFKR